MKRPWLAILSILGISTSGISVNDMDCQRCVSLKTKTTFGGRSSKAADVDAARAGRADATLHAKYVAVLAAVIFRNCLLFAGKLRLLPMLHRCQGLSQKHSNCSRICFGNSSRSWTCECCLIAGRLANRDYDQIISSRLAAIMHIACLPYATFARERMSILAKARCSQLDRLTRIPGFE